MVKQQYAMQFTTRTDYYQTFEIDFDEFWEDYCKKMEFDEEESDISTWDKEDLMHVAWEQILDDPEAHRSGDSDYDNEEIMHYELRMRDV